MKKLDLPKINLQKGAESLKKAVEKANEKITETSRNVMDSAKENAQTLSSKAQTMAYEARMKKYNPLFSDIYSNDNFNIPNLVMLVNANTRKGIDVCEGAIGWLSNEKGVEVLHLYDESVDFSGLKFVPTATRETIYYVDPHKKDTFVNMDCYFSNMQEEKLAELQNIAYSLGAKKYWVEMTESTQETNVFKKETSFGVPLNGINVNSSASDEREKYVASHSTSLAEATWEGTREPVEPELCWYANDSNVKNLIKMRCSENEKSLMTTYNIELNNSNSATMSTNTAAKIDAAVANLGLKGNFYAKSTKEHCRKMVFKLEF